MEQKDQVYCVLDYETFSEVDLRRVGAWEYSVHESTEILCLAFRAGTRANLVSPASPTYTWAPAMPSGTIQLLLNLLENPDVIIVAHNALFEQLITRNVLARDLHTQKYLRTIPTKRWICTAALSAALALPRNLEGAALALKLPVQKDMDGRRLILKWCKPRKPTKNNPATRHSDGTELNRLIKYCSTDVDTEAHLFLKVPPLTPTERRVWELDQVINLRGFQVDRALVATVLKMIEEETAVLNRTTQELTLGVLTSANQRDGVLTWLQDNGVFLPNLQKKTVEDAISAGLVTGDALQMLKLRLAVSKTSTAKYQAFEMRSRHDGRLRDILIYHGASPGRWSGTGVQPQNFPRGTIKDTHQAAELIKEGDLELLRLIYGEPMSIFSSCLRSVITAPEGKVLDVADYAAIEARVLFWVAKHDAGIKAFEEKRDLYRELAGTIFGIEPFNVTSAQRFVGKTATLGCGYSMGAKKFEISCRSLGQDVGPDLAAAAVRAYRSTHRPVVTLWSNIEKAAVAAVENPGKKFTINRTTWYVKDDFLWCVLPSGRRLAYSQPRVVYEVPSWGGTEKRPVLWHHSVNPLTRQWGPDRTYGGKLTENVVQAVARDFMAEAMLRIENARVWQIVLSVHDELVGERDSGVNAETNQHLNEEFCRLMAELPPWGIGCPIAVEGWYGTRYKK